MDGSRSPVVGNTAALTRPSPQSSSPIGADYGYRIWKGKDKMRVWKNVPESVGTACAGSLALVVGCGGDDPQEQAAPATEELVLDCTGVEGGPPPEETNGEDLYYLDTIRESLAAG
jgi:hypothetical protein